MERDEKIKNLYEEVSKLLDEKEYSKVMDICDKIIKNGDDDPFCYYYMAKSLLKLKRIDESLNSIKKSIINFNSKIYENDDPYYYYGRAMALEFYLPNFSLEKETLREFGFFVDEENFSGDLWDVIKIYIMIINRMIEDINKAIAMEPENTEFRLTKVDILDLLLMYTKTDFSCAFKEHINESEIFEEALKECDYVLRKENKNIKALKLKADIYQDLKKYDLAEEIYNEAIKINDKDPDLYFYKAFCLEKLEKYSEALENVDKSIQIDSYDPNAYSLRGRILYHLGKFEESIKDFDKAISLNPDDYFTYLYKGDSLLELKKYDEALEEYNKGIERAPFSATAAARKIYLLKLMNRENEVQKTLSDAINANTCNFYTFKK